MRKFDKSKLIKTYKTIFDRVKGVYVKGVQINPNKDIENRKEILNKIAEAQRQTGILKLSKEIKNSDLFNNYEDFEKIKEYYMQNKATKIVEYNDNVKDFINKIFNTVSDFSFYDSQMLLTYNSATRGFLFESMFIKKLNGNYTSINNQLYDGVFNNIGIQIKYSTNPKKNIDFEGLNSVDGNIISRYNFKKIFNNIVKSKDKITTDDAKNILFNFLKINDNIKGFSVLEYNDLIKNLGLYSLEGQSFSEIFLQNFGLINTEGKIDLNIYDKIKNLDDDKIELKGDTIVYNLSNSAKEQNELRLTIDTDNNIFTLSYVYNDKVQQRIINDNGKVSAKALVNYMHLNFNKIKDKNELLVILTEKKSKYNKILKELEKFFKNFENLDNNDIDAILTAAILTNSYSEFKNLLKANKLNSIVDFIESNRIDKNKIMQSINEINMNAIQKFFSIKSLIDIDDKINYAYEHAVNLPKINKNIKINFDINNKYKTQIEKLLVILNSQLANTTFKGEFGELLLFLLMSDISNKKVLFEINFPKIDMFFNVNELNNLNRIFDYNLHEINSNEMLIQVKTVMKKNKSDKINLTFSKLKNKYNTFEKYLLDNNEIRKNKYISEDSIKNLIDEENLKIFKNELKSALDSNDDEVLQKLIEAIRKLHYGVLLKHISNSENLIYDETIYNLDNFTENFDGILTNNINNLYIAAVVAENTKDFLVFSNKIYSIKNNNITKLKKLDENKLNKILNKLKQFNKLNPDNLFNVANFIIQKESQTYKSEDFEISNSGNNVIFIMKLNSN